MGGQRARGGRRTLHLVFVVAAALAGGCNSVFGIHEGTPPPPCYDPGSSPLLIDDMEDGVGDICNLDERHGYWYTVGDGTEGTLSPAQGATFTPTMIPGGRDGSHYAARFTGSGFTGWGALMGLNLDTVGLNNQPYNASSTGGITFWMKNNAPVSVDVLIPDTVPQTNGGNCITGATNPNCNSHFSFQITAPNADWVHYLVPFSALVQLDGGTATWNPKQLLGFQFVVGPGPAFDVWVDDISFYYGSSTDLLTCADPVFPVSCPAGNSYPAACRLPGTDCSAAATWCSDPLLIDDMEDGNAAICNSGGRQGSWYTAGDGPEGTLSPAQGATFIMTPIPGGRGDSRIAARMTGSGFTGYGALMGLNLDASGGMRRPYDASAAGGVTFWMKTDSPNVGVELPIPATINASEGGSCVDSATVFNCDNHFSFFITPAKTDDWVQYYVPYGALWQAGDSGDPNGNLIVGSATWDPTSLVKAQFSVHTTASFELWIDDLSFYDCSGDACRPTCKDPNAPVACPAAGSVPAACWAVGTDCSTVTQLVRPNFALDSIWGTGADDVWAVGMATEAPAQATILHWDGSKWSSFGTDGLHTLWGVWGSGPDDVWAVGDFGTILHWNGTAWSLSSTALAGPLNSVWGSGRDDVWAVGGNGVILHWDGASWTPSASGTTQYLGLVWGTGPGDAWTVGDAGTILHWNGAAWSPVASGTAVDLSGVWGSGPNDVWAVGSSGTIVHWNGSAWSPVPSGTTQIIVNAWGTGPNDVWAASFAGDILHWDGSAWSTAARTGDYLYSLWGSGSSDVWSVGTGVHHWDGSTWTPLNPNPTAP